MNGACLFFEARGRTTLPELRLKTTHTLTPDNFVHAGVKPLAILSIALHPQKQLHKSIISTIDVKHPPDMINASW